MRRKLRYDIVPEDILAESSNLPDRNTAQFEGRVATPVSSLSRWGVFFVAVFIFSMFVARAYYLQYIQGSHYAAIARDNSMRESVLFAYRGIIYDRNRVELAWNSWSGTASTTATHPLSSTITATTSFASRHYISLPGMAHILGYVQYPQADAKGVWWQTNYRGVAGVESTFNDILAGTNGQRLHETDAHGNSIRDTVIVPPVNGSDVMLSIDAQVQSKFNTVLASHAAKNGFQGGAGVIMDVHTGEIIALTSFPEYNNQLFTEGDHEYINSINTSTRFPLLDRAVGGLYAPGSIVKPIFAAAALNEHLIDPYKTILSTGKIVVPNPYDPDHPGIFRDWTVHGAVDMRTAIAVSSDEYFYTIGGGYAGQKGLGVTKLESYAALFGLGSRTGVDLPNEKSGTIPSPSWKAENFPDDPDWRIGDTYHTAIGQYGFLVTPIQAARFAAALANGGILLQPLLVASTTPVPLPTHIPDEYLQVVREGMKMAVVSMRKDATVKSLNISGFDLAAKTGTAQIGAHNEWMNSWSIGFWPASHPRYAYAVVLERAKAHTPSGAAPALRTFFEWLIKEHPEYTASTPARDGTQVNATSSQTVIQ